MAKFISLGKLNKSLLFIILMSVSNVLNGYIYGFTYIDCFYPMNIYKFLYNWIIDNNKTDFPRHRVFDPLFSYIGVIILSFFFIKDGEEKEKDKEKDKENIEENESRNNSRIVLIFRKKKGYLKDIRGLIYYILIIILWIVEENLLIIYLDIFKDLDFWFFELLCISVIYPRTFVLKIYSHQKLGMAISIIVGSFLKIYSITLTFTSGETNNFYSTNKSLISFVICYFALIILRSYVNTEIKVFLDLKYISQRVLLISYGIAGSFMCLFMGIFTSNVSCSKELENYVCNMTYDGKYYYDNFFNYYESGKNMLVRLIVILLGLLTYFSYVNYCTLIIKILTPIHVIFSFPIQFFIEKTFLLIFTAIFFIERLFNGENLSKRFLSDIFGDIASIIGFLIYFDIIELNFCGLNFNLKKNIMERSETEYFESFMPEDSIGLNNSNTTEDDITELDDKNGK